MCPDNSYDAADKWLLKESLPLSYREHIVQFILQNTGQKDITFDASFRDPFTGFNAYIPGPPSHTYARITDNRGNPLTDETGNRATPFAMGSGHFCPVRAADPGLIYDASYMDYLIYICSLGVTAQNLNVTYNCPKSFPEQFDLNYPSIQVHRLNDTRTIKRAVTNVDRSRSSSHQRNSPLQPLQT